MFLTRLQTKREPCCCTRKLMDGQSLRHACCPFYNLLIHFVSKPLSALNEYQIVTYLHINSTRHTEHCNFQRHSSIISIYMYIHKMNFDILGVTNPELKVSKLWPLNQAYNSFSYDLRPCHTSTAWSTHEKQKTLTKKKNNTHKQRTPNDERPFKGSNRHETDSFLIRRLMRHSCDRASMLCETEHCNQ